MTRDLLYLAAYPARMALYFSQAREYQTQPCAVKFFSTAEPASAAPGADTNGANLPQARARRPSERVA